MAFARAKGSNIILAWMPELSHPHSAKTLDKLSYKPFMKNVHSSFVVLQLPFHWQRSARHLLSEHLAYKLEVHTLEITAHLDLVFDYAIFSITFIYESF